MKSKLILDFATANAACVAAMGYAQKQGWNVAVAIVDDGGHPLVITRTDGTSPISVYIAQDKAKTAAISRRETAIFEQEINSGRFAFITAPIQGALEGGIPFIAQSQTVGAVGIAGVKPHQAAEVAKAAVESFNQSVSQSEES
ncbi:hypothetical protein CUN67_28960 (plasmid) [Pantoea cypripedii]|uniref:Heme-binding protein n=2 Tax=Pantoea cypripedii TaxID=55209 RepID=A0A6B9G8W9_PANCY|nr:hypothetical protein CUN67_28960 [Pantoea cypripedii]